jgi:hypothetical protein
LESLFCGGKILNVEKKLKILFFPGKKNGSVYTGHQLVEAVGPG